MFNFQPTETPEGIPVRTCFEVLDYEYVVDVYGTLYRITVNGDDPDFWFWSVVAYL